MATDAEPATERRGAPAGPGGDHERTPTPASPAVPAPAPEAQGHIDATAAPDTSAKENDREPLRNGVDSGHCTSGASAASTEEDRSSNLSKKRTSRRSSASAAHSEEAVTSKPSSPAAVAAPVTRSPSGSSPIRAATVISPSSPTDAAGVALSPSSSPSQKTAATPAAAASSATASASSRATSLAKDSVTQPQRQKQLRRTCPYLGTIKRHLLDFDFEKVCSICMSNQHVYACLVCARYFQGRGRHTYAHLHALQEKHHVYMNLKDCRVYCLPENYEVKDASLDDIVYNLRPTYTDKDVQELSTRVIYGKALDGTDFIPGCVGLNNLRETDFCNVLIQAVGVASKKTFRIGQKADPLQFFCWLMHRIQKSAHRVKINPGVVEECFQGEVLVKTTTAEAEAQRLPPSTAVTPFLYLTLDLPQAPIFKDSLDRNMIPHVPIFDLLQKFNGEQVLEVSPGTLRRYSLWKLPKYLLLHLKRFSKNNFYVEKNPTIATFPVKHLDLRDYLHADAQERNPVSKYNLVANICHQGKPHDGRYKVHVLHSPTNEWFEIEDLRVTQVLPQFVALSESYMQVYQRQDVAADGSIDEAVVEAELQDMRRKAARAAAAAAAPEEEEDIFAAGHEDEEEDEEEQGS